MNAVPVSPIKGARFAGRTAFAENHRHDRDLPPPSPRKYIADSRFQLAAKQFTDKATQRNNCTFGTLATLSRGSM